MEDCVFNFFDEVKQKAARYKDCLNGYNFVNISGRLLYIEGHAGLTILSKDVIAFKTQKGRVAVEGREMTLLELTENSMLIEGEILKKIGQNLG